jgi:hypothetical protein
MLTSKRAKFSIPPQITYLNCAYMAPLLKSVEKEGIKGLRKKEKSDPGISAGFFYRH